MKSTFKEYYQYTEQEFKALWKNCLFVFDTNALLNMYRYSRETVDAYFRVLTKLREKRQLWIPYQVGYEFHEERINVISEYEGSYDAILSVLEEARSEIKRKYKHHPFLDLERINQEIESTEAAIKKTKGKHPKWLENDDVLERITGLFKGNVGENYDETKLCEIKKEGTERYDKKIPPGFRDDKKDDNKKFGDLILWYQIIDKANESEKPIVFISGDVKGDWWLEKNGKRIMPLPQLRKEMYEKAKVDFHIYTPDRFLKWNETDENKIDDRTIKEVRRIGELEEERMTTRRMELTERARESKHRDFERRSMEYIHIFGKLERLFMEINNSEIPLRYRERLDYMFHRLRALRNQIIQGESGRSSFDNFYQHVREISSTLKSAAHSGGIDPRLSMRISEYAGRWEDLIHNFRRYL